jgi:glycosyltransferase involved in cell wall biosynthesis
MCKSSYISIVSPVYNAENIIVELVKQIESNTKKITENYEIILIEDSSSDSSWNVIVDLCNKNKKVKGIKLSRNFGQHRAISAGTEISTGEYTIIIDCDLQHNPKYIIDLHEKIKEGYDVVLTKTSTRCHSLFKNISAYLYYRLMNFLSDYNMDPNICSFSILSRKALLAFNQLKDCDKLYLWALNWIGFKQSIINIDHNHRYKGVSSYNFTKLFNHALNVTISNSDRALKIMVFLGFFISFSASLLFIIILFQYFFSGLLEGWTSLMISITFFCGIILTSVGILGLYISKIFEQTKNRPRYIIQESLNHFSDNNGSI